jgi:hypothetical protein
MFFVLVKTMDEKRRSIYAVNIDQNVPRSNISPKSDISRAGLVIEEMKNTATTRSPEVRAFERGMTTLPSINRPRDQAMIARVRPPTTRSPFPVSTGIRVNGKKNTGSRTITAYSDQNEIVSKVLALIRR